jgi:hypothetical protein
VNQFLSLAATLGGMSRRVASGSSGKKPVIANLVQLVAKGNETSHADASTELQIASFWQLRQLVIHVKNMVNRNSEKPRRSD